MADAAAVSATFDYRTATRIVRALVDGEAAFFAAIDATPGFQPRLFAEFVAGQRLLPWTAPALSGDEARRRFPPDALEIVTRRGARARELSERVLAETLEVHGALERGGVDWLLLKGVTFGARFYPDVRRRYQRDVDVLVREADVDRAVEALRAIGFEREPNRIGEGAVRLGLVRGESQLDLHWNLRRRARRRVSEERLWEEAVPFAFGGRSFRTLGDDAVLTFHLISLCGDLRRGATGVRHHLDTHLLLRAFEPATDWDAFFRARARQSIEKPCVNAIAFHLALWEAAGVLPRLAAAVGARRRLVEISGTDEAFALASAPRGNPDTVRWYRRAYPYDGLADWGRRWTLDLPRTLSRLAGAGAFRMSRA
jgi:hypothetical protein